MDQPLTMVMPQKCWTERRCRPTLFDLLLLGDTHKTHPNKKKAWVGAQLHYSSLVDVLLVLEPLNQRLNALLLIIGRVGEAELHLL